MNSGPEDPRSEWDPLGWEMEEPDGPSNSLPVPLVAEVVTWTPPDDPPPPPRSPALGMLVASVLLAVVGLVGIGIGVGSVFFNQDTPAPEVVVVTPPQLAVAPADEPAGDVQPPPAAAAPSPVPPGDPTPAADPVVEVARAVIPSVVLIEVGPRGQGSGIIYDESGLILTNAHVVGTADEVTVQFADGTRAEGEVVGSAVASDVALVRADTDLDLTPATFADRSTVEVGQLAVAVGSPFGLDQSVTSGVVSAVRRAISGGGSDRAIVEMIQTDAPINPGNSGGALANRSGQVIGMNTLIQTDGSFGNIGLGFAIPSDIALNFAERILTGASTEFGYLGVWGADPDVGRPGALVLQVVPGTPADRAGLREGDLIIHIDDEEVSTFTELAAKIQFRVPGTEAELELLRDGELVTLTIVVGDRPSVEELEAPPDDG
ncbi:S1C family serine protease [Candidatus Poriferisocius sp.]|uniref:S1C family serine protease n=1 Tax=Candidatus Poriferisocius sp. TaxID=3101276 RepID=UPI003B5A697D